MIVVIALTRRPLGWLGETGFGRFFRRLWDYGEPARPMPTFPVSAPVGQPPRWLTNRIGLFLIFSLLAIGLFYRHVMFVRLYTGEALQAYAAAPLPNW
jgi:hypothetical protein